MALLSRMSMLLLDERRDRELSPGLSLMVSLNHRVVEDRSDEYDEYPEQNTVSRWLWIIRAYGNRPGSRILLGVFP
jgi:hypothetical protein